MELQVNTKSMNPFMVKLWSVFLLTLLSTQTLIFTYDIRDVLLSHNKCDVTDVQLNNSTFYKQLDWDVLYERDGKSFNETIQKIYHNGDYVGDMGKYHVGYSGTCWAYKGDLWWSPPMELWLKVFAAAFSGLGVVLYMLNKLKNLCVYTVHSYKKRFGKMYDDIEKQDLIPEDLQNVELSEVKV